jgi:8-oxo-dGTP diphosphatase
MELQVGVKIMLQNSEGKYLLLKRASEKGSAVDEYWDMPGGRINPGSILIENLQREVSEETGLEIKGEIKLINAQDIIRPHKHIVRLTYLGYADGDVILSTEHSEYKWLNKEEIKTLEPIDSYFKEVFDKFLN